MSRKRKSFRK